MANKLQRQPIKRIMKGNMKKRVGGIADLMVQVDLLLFIHRLAEEARSKAFEEKSATIKAHHVRASTKKILKKLRG